MSRSTIPQLKPRARARAQMRSASVMCSRARAIPLLLFLLLASAAPAPRRLQLTFTQRSPQSSLDNVLAKMDIDLYRLMKPKEADVQHTIWQYDLSQQRFDI